jgi:predicted ATPase
MLNRVKVKGFKSIKDMELDLRPLNVLIGANGAGKSNFISLFYLINRIIEKRLQLYIGQSGGVDPLLYFGQKITDKMSVKLDFQQNGYEFELIPTKENTFVFSHEGCFTHSGGDSSPYCQSLGHGQKESNLPGEAQNHPGKAASHVLDCINSWKVYHFHDTGDSSKMKQPGNINDNFMLRPDASNLAAFLFYLKEVHPRDYQNIVDTVRLAAPFLEDFILRPTPHNKEFIQMEWREKESEAYFNAHYFSDGTLRFICLATLLLQPDLPSTILLDEPELGLHPYAITLLSSLLQSAASRTQVIVSTQSVTLVNQFTPEDIIVVDREKKQSIFRRLDKKSIENWLDDYGIGDLWEKNIFGGRPTNE